MVPTLGYETYPRWGREEEDVRNSWIILIAKNYCRNGIVGVWNSCRCTGERIQIPARPPFLRYSSAVDVSVLLAADIAVSLRDPIPSHRGFLVHAHGNTRRI